jgi:hypothetical protein
MRSDTASSTELDSRATGGIYLGSEQFCTDEPLIVVYCFQTVAAP